MSIWDRATEEAANRMISDSDGSETATAAGSAQIAGRGATATVGGEDIDVEEPETKQTEEGTWLTAKNKYGWPRGREALQARRISETWAMELITNAIVDQLAGGELAFESDDDDVDQAEAEMQALLRDILNGPHLMDDDLDDLITAAVADMVGPGNAYWQLLPASNGSLPVVSLVPLDALTIRHNYNRHGYPRDPPYYQAPGAFTADGAARFGAIDPTPLQSEQVAAMRCQKGRRSYQIYPKSPSIQVLETLELLVNSTTHHNRFYDDDQIPAGFIQIMNAGEQSVQKIQDKLQQAAGDPRSVEVIGGEGAAQWIEMGGTAINLNVIEEQKWFLQLCLASIGLGKQEIGLIEDVNRSNGEVESARVFKRVTGPFAKQIENAFRHIAEQFDVYNALDQPFDIKLRFSDPREERAREERLRKMYQAGGLTLRQYARRRGDEDLADNEMAIELNGQEVVYGDHPKWVAQELLAEARSDPDASPADDQEDGDDEDQLE